MTAAVRAGSGEGMSSEMEDVLLLSRDEGLLTLTMNRPESRNALNLAMLEQMLDALRGAERDSEIRAIVLTGSGKAFCSGGDVKAMAAGSERAATFDRRVRDLRMRMEVSRLLHQIPKPTIAAIRGAAAAPACPWRWPAICASRRLIRNSPRPSRRSACPAISAAAISCRRSSAAPRRGNSIC